MNLMKTQMPKRQPPLDVCNVESDAEIELVKPRICSEHTNMWQSAGYWLTTQSVRHV
jgi:hypothetical protein